MCFLPLWIALWSALGLSQLRRLGLLPARAQRVGLAAAGLTVILALPHAIFGWDVRQHVPAAYLTWSMGWIALECMAAMSIGLWGFTLHAMDVIRLRLASPPQPDPSRRAFLEKVLVRAPLCAAAVGAPAGVLEAEAPPPLRLIRLALPNLPPGLEGMRILQISDLHLGPVLGLDWLERALQQLPAVDLVAITGDLSDDRALIRPALLRLLEIPAPLGHVAILGNHEYYIGVRHFLDAMGGTGIKLLRNESIPLARQGSDFALLGLDYPARVPLAKGGPLGGDPSGKMSDKQVLRRFVAVTDSVRPASFRLLLSHHPDAFDTAAERGIDLTLAGHTHGGQIDIGGITPIQVFLKYVRGHYAQGQSQLYVTTGLGHWFPFRISCPTELPVFELRRAGPGEAKAI